MHICSINISTRYEVLKENICVSIFFYAFSLEKLMFESFFYLKKKKNNPTWGGNVLKYKIFKLNSLKPVSPPHLHDYLCYASKFMMSFFYCFFARCSFFYANLYKEMYLKNCSVYFCNLGIKSFLLAMVLIDMIR
jgi:hypothetical protein